MIITIIKKITTNDKSNNKDITRSNPQNNNKKETIKSPPCIQKSLSSKRTSPIKIQMLSIFVIKLLDTYFNIKPT